MSREVLTRKIAKILDPKAPRKARQIVTILRDEFGEAVDRRTVNSILYEMKKDGAATVNSDHRWTRELGKGPRSAKPATAISGTPAPAASRSA